MRAPHQNVATVLVDPAMLRPGPIFAPAALLTDLTVSDVSLYRRTPEGKLAKIAPSEMIPDMTWRGTSFSTPRALSDAVLRTRIFRDGN